MPQNLMSYLPKLSESEKDTLLGILEQYHTGIRDAESDPVTLMLFPRGKALRALRRKVATYKASSPYYYHRTPCDRLFQLIWGLGGNLTVYQKRRVRRYENYYKIIPIRKR